MENIPANSRNSRKAWLLSAAIPFMFAFVVGIAIGAYEVDKDSGKTVSAIGREETFAEATVECLQVGFFLAIPAAIIGLVGRGGLLLLGKRRR